MVCGRPRPEFRRAVARLGRLVGLVVARDCSLASHAGYEGRGTCVDAGTGVEEVSSSRRLFDEFAPLGLGGDLCPCGQQQPRLCRLGFAPPLAAFLRGRFAQSLLQGKVLDRPQLDLLRHRAGLLGGGLDRHALEMGLLGVDEVMSLYAQSLDLPPARALDLDRLNRQKSSAFPSRLAHRWRLIPVQQMGLSWLVLSDECPTPQRRDEVRLTLGVELLVRAVPPFLFELLHAWLNRLPQNQDLALLASRLYPRFIYRPSSHELAHEPMHAPEAERVSGLPQRLEPCEGGEACLEEVEHYLAQRHHSAAVWRINGPVLTRSGAGKSAVSLGSLEGLKDVLSDADVRTFSPVPKGWEALFGASVGALRAISVRPVCLGGQPVALLVLGANTLSFDGAAVASIDDAAAVLRAALVERLG